MRNYKKFSNEELLILEKSFKTSSFYPHREKIEKLAKSMRTSPAKVDNWFKYKRRKMYYCGKFSQYKIRKIFTTQENNTLNSFYELFQKPTYQKCKEIANTLPGITTYQVKNWFSNRRRKMRYDLKKLKQKKNYKNEKNCSDAIKSPPKKSCLRRAIGTFKRDTSVLKKPKVIQKIPKLKPKAISKSTKKEKLPPIPEEQKNEESLKDELNIIKKEEIPTNQQNTLSETPKPIIKQETPPMTALPPNPLAQIPVSFGQMSNPSHIQNMNNRMYWPNYQVMNFPSMQEQQNMMMMQQNMAQRLNMMRMFPQYHPNMFPYQNLRPPMNGMFHPQMAPTFMQKDLRGDLFKK